MCTSSLGPRLAQNHANPATAAHAAEIEVHAGETCSRLIRRTVTPLIALANETAGQTQPPSLTQQQIQALAAALSSALPSLPSAPTLEDYVAFAVEILASQRQPPRRPRKEN